VIGAPLSPPGDELLDHPDADPEAVATSLRHIAVANRWFGGWWAVRRGLAVVTRRLGDRAPLGSASARPGREGVLQGGSTTERPSGAQQRDPGARESLSTARRLLVLDVGCGMGDLAARAATWGARRGLEIQPIGLERHRTAAALSRRQGVAMLLGCASALPIRDKAVDIVIASQLIHHLSPDRIMAFCREADRIARLGVVIADLRRSRHAIAGFWLGSRLFGFDANTRRDGLTSVRRGFSTRELGTLLAQAGIRAKVEQSPGFRLVATWTPEHRA
jgi:SAM-dependent methyltransferase